MKELEDHQWFPKLMRRYQTDYIGFAVTLLNVYRPFIEYIRSNNNLNADMFDLCSGSGEPAVSIFRKSQKFGQLILSDKFPDMSKTFKAPITYLSESIDVMHFKFSPVHTYTMFNAFHHFSDEEKIRIISEIRASGAKAFFVEILQPSFICFIKVLFATSIGLILLTPFIKPLSFLRILLIPVNMLTTTYDGLISVIKSRSLKQYRSLFSNDQQVKVMRINGPLNPMIVIQVN